ncbi:MAG: CBS domain-containing protein [Chloroflexota bacterium]
MNVCDVMTARPTVIASGATLREALTLMCDAGCHHLPVVSAEKHLIGVLSFHDCQRVLGDLLTDMQVPDNLSHASAMHVSDAMTPAPTIVEPDALAHEAAHLMLEHVIGCLPVMRGETLVGIVTRSDLLMAFMNLSQKSVRRPYP